MVVRFLLGRRRGRRVSGAGDLRQPLVRAQRTIARELVHHAEHAGHRAVDVDRVRATWCRRTAGAGCSSSKGCRRVSGRSAGGRCVQDRPAQAPWLDADGTRRRSKPGIAAGAGRASRPVRNYGEAFRSPTVVRMTVLYFFWGLSLFGFVLWLPTIIKEAGSANIVRTGWLSAGPVRAAPAIADADRLDGLRSHARSAARSCCRASASAAPRFWRCTRCTGRTSGCRTPCCASPGIGPIVALAPFFAIPADILPKNVAGGAVALINSLGALGGFLGSYVVGWINGLTHDPSSSFLLMGVTRHRNGPVGDENGLVGGVSPRPAHCGAVAQSPR